MMIPKPRGSGARSPDVYGLYQRGIKFLAAGDAHAAATVLERAVAHEPAKGSLRELLGRAYYSARRYADALDQFVDGIELDPVNDYAYFAAGLCLGRLGRLEEAVGQLKLAHTMRPEINDYSRALRRLEATRDIRGAGRFE
jgi:tetratricopeptide (TPR) repeat protein